VTALEVAVPLIGAAAKKTSGNPTIFILLIIGVGFYFLIYRPQQRKAKVVREQGKTFDVGDEVLTAGGIVGYVIDIEDDRVTLETSVGASFVVLKQYILRKLEEAVPAEADDADEDDAEYGDLGDGEDQSELEAGDDSDGVDGASHDADEEEEDDVEEQVEDDSPSTNGDSPPGRRRSRWRSSKDASPDDGGPGGPPAS
jgi:preprotein translocase subunit YajC